MTFDIEPVLTWQRRGIVDLIDAYIERRKETAELLAIPGLYEKVWASSREFRRRKSLSLVDA
jgi:hypothetical protein